MDESLHSSRTKLAELLRARSLQRGAFTLASGRHSTYYIDARAATMSAAGMELIGKAGLATIRSEEWDVDLVGGLTLGADPVAYAIARASRDSPPEIDAFTVRKEPKGHGMARQIEGCFRPGARVVVVEDVVTSGGSALRAADALTTAGASIAGVLAVLDREEGGRAAIEAAGYDLRTLVRLTDLGIEPNEGASA